MERAEKSRNKRKTVRSAIGRSLELSKMVVSGSGEDIARSLEGNRHVNAAMPGQLPYFTRQVALGGETAR